MAHISLDIYSESLGMQTNVQIVMPQQNTLGEIGVNGKKTNEAFKCLYLLHGLSDDQTIWMRRTSIERYATEHGICVVMPMGARSFYSDMKYGQKYYTFISQELPKIIESAFNVSGKREDRFIGGNSMGGYGALKIALNNPDKYSAVFGLSSVANIYNPRFAETLVPVFGGEIPKRADLFEIVKEHNIDAQKPRVYMTIGKDDFMFYDNEKLAKYIKSLDYDYTYVVTEGNHSWILWDNTVQSALKWMLEK